MMFFYGFNGFCVFNKMTDIWRERVVGKCKKSVFGIFFFSSRLGSIKQSDTGSFSLPVSEHYLNRLEA